MGKRYVLGNHRLIEERGQCSTEPGSPAARARNCRPDVTVLASDGAVLGIFAVADGIKAAFVPMQWRNSSRSASIR